ncbi:MAG: pyridoxal phosphate-dependent aminotransferase [Vicinamibacterales bacterium]
MFSSRVPAALGLNRLSAALAAHRAAGRALIDLTATNPTTVGIRYPDDILTPLADPAGRVYRPEPFGLPAARQAVTADFARRGISVAEDRVVLTASTSEAYSLLFKLLCAPGDDVLVPAPSYPLFDHLTQLDGVRAQPYALEYHGRWELDAHSVDTAWTDRTRAVLAVSPNNPTGSVLSAVEFDALATRCAERDAALIVDEVFADYSLGLAARDLPVTPDLKVGPTGALTFRLGGLSKSAGLPQVKLGWIAVDGPDALVLGALERLELICDTYLSVSTPVQVAAPALIAGGAAIRAQLQERVRGNYATLRQAAAASPAVELLAADAGWSAVLRVPSKVSEEDLVMALLADRGVLVHPGFFFDFPREAFLVSSLLPEPAVFAEGVTRVMEHVGD